jgi:hypothetical protein
LALTRSTSIPPSVARYSKQAPNSLNPLEYTLVGSVGQPAHRNVGRLIHSRVRSRTSPMAKHVTASLGALHLPSSSSSQSALHAGTVQIGPFDPLVASVGGTGPESVRMRASELSDWTSVCASPLKRSVPRSVSDVEQPISRRHETETVCSRRTGAMCPSHPHDPEFASPTNMTFFGAV